MENIEVVKHLELLYEFSKLDTNPKLKFKQFALKKAINEGTIGCWSAGSPVYQAYCLYHVVI